MNSDARPSESRSNTRQQFFAGIDRGGCFVGGASKHCLVPRPLVQHPHAKARRQPDARPVLDRPGEQFLRLGETIAGIEQAIDLGAVLGLLLDLVEIAIVGIRRTIRLFVEVDVSGLRYLRHGERITRSGQEGR